MSLKLKEFETNDFYKSVQSNVDDKEKLLCDWSKGTCNDFWCNSYYHENSRILKDQNMRYKVKHFKAKIYLYWVEYKDRNELLLKLLDAMQQFRWLVRAADGEGGISKSCWHSPFGCYKPQSVWLRDCLRSLWYRLRLSFDIMLSSISELKSRGRTGVHKCCMFVNNDFEKQK